MFKIKDTTNKTAQIFKAFSDENRIRILDTLKNGEHCACELLEELQISQSTLSHHMKILTDANIVNGRKEGKWMHYSLNHDGVNKAMRYLDGCMNTKKEVTGRLKEVAYNKKGC